MDRYDEVFAAIKVNLKATQLLMRNKRWAFADDKDKADIIDKQITDILNPKEKKTIVDLTKDVLSREGVIEEKNNEKTC